MNGNINECMDELTTFIMDEFDDVIEIDGRITQWMNEEAFEVGYGLQNEEMMKEL